MGSSPSVSISVFLHKAETAGCKPRCWEHEETVVRDKLNKLTNCIRCMQLCTRCAKSPHSHKLITTTDNSHCSVMRPPTHHSTYSITAHAAPSLVMRPGQAHISVYRSAPDLSCWFQASLAFAKTTSLALIYASPSNTFPVEVEVRGTTKSVDILCALLSSPW